MASADELSRWLDGAPYIALTPLGPSSAFVNFKFGTYSFPNTFYPELLPASRVIPMPKLPRAHGARVLAGYLDGKKITVRGGFINSVSLEDDLDALRAGLAQGPCDFQFLSNRKYRLCQALGYSDTYDATWWQRIVTIQFDLVTGDPFAYDMDDTTVNLVSSGGLATALGNAAAAPALSLTMGTTGAVSLTCENLTTGESFTLAGSVVSGNVIVIDSLAQTVTIGGADRIDLFDGLWPTLVVGDNVFLLTVTSGTVSAQSATWKNRWL